MIIGIILERQTKKRFLITAPNGDKFHVKNRLKSNEEWRVFVEDGDEVLYGNRKFRNVLRWIKNTYPVPE